MAPLAESPEIGQAIVAGVPVEMRGGEHDVGGPEGQGFDQVGPPGGTTAAVAPCRGAFVVPAPVGTQLSRAKCGRPQTWHRPPARWERTLALSSRQCGG